MLGSNMSQQMTDVSSGELTCVCLNCAWETDGAYTAFPVNATDWFEAAGRIAQDQQQSKSDWDRMAIWRDYQYQWLYHMFQGAAQRQGKEFIFYGGMQYTKERYRRGKSSLQYIDNGLRNLHTTPQFYVGFLVRID